LRTWIVVAALLPSWVIAIRVVASHLEMAAVEEPMGMLLVEAQMDYLVLRGDGLYRPPLGHDTSESRTSWRGDGKPILGWGCVR
jgi:hypothetical protein